MRQLFEIFYILQIQKRIVSAETIHGNTVHSMTFNYSLALERTLLVWAEIECTVHIKNVNRRPKTTPSTRTDVITP